MRKYWMGALSVLCCFGLTGCAVAPGGKPFFTAVGIFVVAAGLLIWAIYRTVQRQSLIKRHSSRFPKKMLIKADILTGIMFSLAAVGVIVSGYMFYKSTALVVPPPKEPSDLTTATTSPYATTPELPWKTFPVDQEIESENYFVFSVAQDDFLESTVEETDTLDPSHIVNLFTAFVVTQHMQPNDPIRVTKDMLELVPEDAVKCGYEADSNHYTKVLVEAMLVADASDAAYVLAVHLGREMLATAQRPPEEIPAAEALSRFIEEMNTVAKENGILNTVFVNPDGSPAEEQITTVGDMVAITRLLFRFDSILKYTATDQFTYSPNPYESQMWVNPNRLINDSDEFYCPYALGMKMTEYTEGRHHLLTAFRSNGQTLIIGILDSDNIEQMTIDALHLFNTTMGV